ncbi:MAG: hypothetical protein ACLUIQ_02600 [Dialister invisus]
MAVEEINQKGRYRLSSFCGGPKGSPSDAMNVTAVNPKEGGGDYRTDDIK